MNRYEITFEYCDQYSRGRWSEQSCSVVARSEYEAIKKCKELYGLGIDCEYRIKKVTTE